jgi:hypothetical protein
MDRREMKTKSNLMRFRTYLDRSKKKTKMLLPNISDPKQPDNGDKKITVGNQIMLPATPRLRDF